MTHIGFAALAVAPVLSNAQDSSPSAPAGEAPAITVTVVATRSPEPTLETPGSDVAVTVDQMRAQGAVSLGDALKYEPGVSVPFDFSAGDGLVPYLSGGDQGVNVRGIEGNRIAIQLDGIRQPEDFVAQSFLGAGGPGRIYFDPATLAQVEIFKSAASNLYGSDAMGGAVAGRTVSPASLLGSGLSGQVIEDSLTWAGVDESINNRLAGAYGDGRWAGSVVHSYRDGHERMNNGDPDPNPKDFDSHAVVSKLAHKLGDWVFEGTVDYFASDTFTEGNSAEGVFFGGMIVNSNINLDEEKERTRLSLGSRFTPSGDAGLVDALDVLVYWQDARAESYSVQQGSVAGQPRDRRNAIAYKTTIAGVDAQVETLLDGETIFQTLRYGLELSRSDVESAFIRTDFATDGSATIFDRIGMAPSEVLRAGFFVLDEIGVGADERWLVTPGLRVDFYDVSPDNSAAFLARTVRPDNGEAVAASDFDNWAIAPSLSVLYRITPDLNTYVTYAHGIRNPSAEELNGVFTHGTDFVVLPNPALKEETSDSFEVGLQGHSDEHAFQLAVFYNLYDDFLESNVLVIDNPAPEPDILSTVNRREVEIHGVELSWDWTGAGRLLGVPGIELGASFSWTEGEETRVDEATGADIDLPVNSIEPWQVVSYIGYRAPDGRWGLRLTGRHVAAKDIDDINQSDTPLLPTGSFFVLDLAGRLRLTENWSINAGLNNLTDEEYYLWSTARRGGGHGGETGSLYSQPGLNGFVSLTASF